MSQKNAKFRLTACLVAVIILIIDNKTAFEAAMEGFKICINVLIPSMFPLMVLCCMLTEFSVGVQSKLFNKICKRLGFPAGGESILISGLLGGYPVGAIAVTEAYKKGSLSKPSAEKLLGCCSNAGPAFIFGVCASQFSSANYCLILWLIHIASALITMRITVANRDNLQPYISRKSINISLIVANSVKNMANICAWIILFRILIHFLCRWFLWALPNEITTMIIGILDLSNGAVMLQSAANDSIRLVLASFMLSFGGVCVYLQTSSVCADLSTRKYIPSKLYQGIISVILAFGCLVVMHRRINWLLFLVPMLCMVIYLTKKKIYTGKIAKHHV